MICEAVRHLHRAPERQNLSLQSDTDELLTHSESPGSFCHRHSSHSKSLLAEKNLLNLTRFQFVPVSNTLNLALLELSPHAFDFVVQGAEVDTKRVSKR